MKILILCAMKEEAMPLIIAFDLKEKIKEKVYAANKKDGNYIELWVVGVGKSNAIISTTTYSHIYNIDDFYVYDRVINFGAAGISGGPYEIGDICKIERFYNSSFAGETESCPKYNPGKIDNTIGGLACFSGSIFSKQVSNEYREHCGEEYFFDMEAYILALLCKRVGKKFSCIKIVSDNLNEKSNETLDELKIQMATDKKLIDTIKTAVEKEFY